MRNQKNAGAEKAERMRNGKADAGIAAGYERGAARKVEQRRRSHERSGLERSAHIDLLAGKVFAQAIVRCARVRFHSF